MTTGPVRGEGFYKLLLRAFPRPFRRRFGNELLLAFRAQRKETEYSGAGGAVRFWRDVGVDWARTVVAARRTSQGTGMLAAPERFSRATETGRWEVVVDALRQDLGFALRSLFRSPGFSIVAVLTLAIGIGSNAAIFGVVKSVLLEPLPYGEPEEVATIWSSWAGFPKTWVSENEYRLYLTSTRSFDDLAIWNETNVTWTDPENPERVLGAMTTENLPTVLGIEMAVGRFFTTEEAVVSDSLPSATIVISHEAWVRRYSRDPGVVGRMADVNGRNREIVGVLPEGFRLPTQFGSFQVADVYFPAYVPRTEVTAYPEGGGSHGSYVVGRLRDGVTVESARVDVEAAIERVRQDFDAYPPDRAFQPLVYAASDDVFGSIRPALLALLATVVFVLLIACANVANLMLARSEDRADELTVRAALGAGRGRLISQLLVESLVLATIGGLAGCGLALGSVELFKTLNPGNLPRIDEVALDGGVLAFAAAVTLGTAVLFGVLPALRVTGEELRARSGRRSERGGGRGGWQGTLVAAELALAVVLVVGAGLMVRTFGALTSIEPGFGAENTLTLAISLPTTRYPDPASATTFYRELLQDLEALPGVRSAASIRALPIASPIGDWGLDVQGYDESVNPRAAGDWQIASPGYFGAIGIPLSSGRDFDWNDDAEGASVGIVNEAFVQRYWPTESPIGRTFTMGRIETTVVGVAGNVRHNGLTEEIKPKFYIPLAQWGSVSGGIPTSQRLVISAAEDPAGLVQPVRGVVRAKDPSLAVAEVFTIDEVLAAEVAQPRFVVVLMGAFSAIAVILSLIGIYGVVAYGVGRRTQEIGIRMALGAVQGEIVGLMVRKGTAMVLMGLAAGLALAFVLSRFLESLLYGVSATDPATFAAVCIGFAGVAWVATWVPARRAARIDPIRALKAE